MRDEERERVLAELARLSSDVQHWAEEVVGRIEEVAAAVSGAAIAPAVSRASSRVIAAPRVSRRSSIRRVISMNSAEGSAGAGSRIT